MLRWIDSRLHHKPTEDCDRQSPSRGFSICTTRAKSSAPELDAPLSTRTNVELPRERIADADGFLVTIGVVFERMILSAILTSWSNTPPRRYCRHSTAPPGLPRRSTIPLLTACLRALLPQAYFVVSARFFDPFWFTNPGSLRSSSHRSARSSVAASAAHNPQIPAGNIAGPDHMEDQSR